MKELLFVVDMVNGFVKEGSMHDAKIMDIVEVISRVFIMILFYLRTVFLGSDIC